MKKIFLALLLIIGLFKATDVEADTIRGWITNACMRSGCTMTGTFNTLGVSPTTDNTRNLGDATHRWLAVYPGRLITGASTPSITGTGGGTGATYTAGTGSSDLAGNIAINTGTSPAALGTVTVTFSTGNGALGTNGPVCVAMLTNSTGTWNARASVIGGTMNTTSALFNWDNNAVALGAGLFIVDYVCIGK